MKKHFLTKVLMVMLSAMMIFILYGCGDSDSKDERRERKDKEKNESTIKSFFEEELNEKVKEESYLVDESDSADYTWNDESVVAEEEIEPLPEIMEADFTDMMVQVDDFIIKFDGTKTLAEYVELLPEGYVAEFDREIATLNELVNYGTGIGIYKGTSIDNQENYIGSIGSGLYCPSETVRLGTLPCGDISIYPRTYSGKIYLAGGFCVSDIDTDERFSFDNIKDTLDGMGMVGFHYSPTWQDLEELQEKAKQNNENVIFYFTEDDLDYEIYSFNEDGDIFSMGIRIDPKTGMVDKNNGGMKFTFSSEYSLVMVSNFSEQ